MSEAPKTGPGPSPQPGQATAREFVTILFRRRWIILGLFLATTITVFVVAFSTPTSYVSSGRVLYKPGEQASALDPDRRIYSQWEQELGSELELVKSVPVADRARAILKADAGPGGRPLPLDPKAIDAEVMGKSNVILIGYSDGDPEVAQRVCDAVVRAYLEYRRDLNLRYPADFFNRELSGVMAKLEARNRERLRYSDERGVVNADEQTRALINQLVGLEQQRASVTTDLAEARASMSVMRDLQTRPGIDVPLPASPMGLDVLQQLKQKIIDQEARVASLRERYRDESPEIANALETLETLRAMLRREVSSRLEVLDSRSRVLLERQQAIDGEIAGLRAQLGTMPAKESHLDELDRDIALLKKRYEDLVQKSDLARVTENVIPTSTVLLLSPAGPARPTNTRDYVRLALAPAFSLLVGIGLSVFIDGLDITVRTAPHAEESVNVPVLAALPERRRRG